MNNAFQGQNQHLNIQADQVTELRKIRQAIHAEIEKLERCLLEAEQLHQLSVELIHSTFPGDQSPASIMFDAITKAKGT